MKRIDFADKALGSLADFQLGLVELIEKGLEDKTIPIKEPFGDSDYFYKNEAIKPLEFWKNGYGEYNYSYCRFPKGRKNTKEKPVLESEKLEDMSAFHLWEFVAKFVNILNYRECLEFEKEKQTLAKEE